MKSMIQLLTEAQANAFNAAAQGVLMHAVDNNKNAPGAQSMAQLVQMLNNLRKSGKASVQASEIVRNALQMGIKPQDIAQFCASVLDSGERDEFGGYGHEVLAQTRDAFSKSK